MKKNLILIFLLSVSFLISIPIYLTSRYSPLISDQEKAQEWNSFETLEDDEKITSRIIVCRCDKEHRIGSRMIRISKSSDKSYFAYIEQKNSGLFPSFLEVDSNYDWLSVKFSAAELDGTLLSNEDRKRIMPGPGLSDFRNIDCIKVKGLKVGPY